MLFLFPLYRDELFVTEGGARPSAIKILIVITDGRSNDEPHLRGAVEKAEKKNIIRYAIGVRIMFSLTQGLQALKRTQMQNHKKYY